MPIVVAYPLRLVDGLARPLDKCLANKGRALPSPVYPPPFPTSLRHWQCDTVTCSGFTLPKTVRVDMQLSVTDGIFGVAVDRRQPLPVADRRQHHALRRQVARRRAAP